MNKYLKTTGLNNVTVVSLFNLALGTAAVFTVCVLTLVAKQDGLLMFPPVQVGHFRMSAALERPPPTPPERKPC